MGVGRDGSRDRPRARDIPYQSELAHRDQRRRCVYTATDASHGSELWFSDGTAGGTKMIRDINPGAADSHINDPSRAGGFVYFSARDATHGDELWRTDGTHNGTTVVCGHQPDGIVGPALRNG